MCSWTPTAACSWSTRAAGTSSAARRRNCGSRTCWAASIACGKIGAKPPDDPRGRNIDWAKQTPHQLWSLFRDDRPAVRQRASREFVHRQNTPEMQRFLARIMRDGNPENIPDANLRDENADVRPDAVRTAMARPGLSHRWKSPNARQIIRDYFLRDASEPVRHVALQSFSLNRDDGAKGILARELQFSKSAANRRIAAEALGRLGDRLAVPNLLDAAEKADDRVLQHSIIYALIELADPTATRRTGYPANRRERSPPRSSRSIRCRAASFKASDVIQHLSATDDTLRQAAHWVVIAASRLGRRIGGMVCDRN